MVYISVMFQVMDSVHVLNMMIVVNTVLEMHNRLNMLDDMVNDLVDHWLMDNFAVHDRLVDNFVVHNRLVDNFLV